MEAALLGIASTAKQQTLKDAANAAKEAVSHLSTHSDTSPSYVRDKCLTAFELAFDVATAEKTQHYAVEGVQALLRDPRFHSHTIENPADSLASQVLHSLNGVAQWNHKLQCHSLTLIVELICSVELRVPLSAVQEALELCLRVYTSSREESPRVSARAAASQLVTSYCTNRYAISEDGQSHISVYLDATLLLEATLARLDQLNTASDQAVILLDAANSLLSAQPLSIQQHAPFVNLLWEKLCPMLIRMLGVPEKNSPSPSPVAPSSDEPVGQGHMARFPLSPAAIAHPEATRALYLVIEQVIRLMADMPSMNSVLEAVFHKAFLYPKIEQRGEAIKVIRKMLSSPARLTDLVSHCVLTKSLSLWRMLVVCVYESANPSFDVSIEAVRACTSMLQGVLAFCSEPQLKEDIAEQLREMFPDMQAATVTSFDTNMRTSSAATIDLNREISIEIPGRLSYNRSESTVSDVFAAGPDEDMSGVLKKLSRKLLECEDVRESCDADNEEEERKEWEREDCTSARSFVRALCEAVPEWESMRATLNVDEAILTFAANYYKDFCASTNQQFLVNTDALYLTAIASLALAKRSADTVTWSIFKSSVLTSGCIVYVSEGWLQQVFDAVCDSPLPRTLLKRSALADVIADYDGFDCQLLSDVERLQRISRGSSSSEPPCFDEKLAARWLVSSAWDCIVSILSTFLGINRAKVRAKVVEGIERAIQGTQTLANVALVLELGSRCGWIFERLVEASCDVDALRQAAAEDAARNTAEESRLSSVARLDLLSMQLVLDRAMVAIHSPDCWKHVVRCTEYVWELEKYIYGALCYEKPTASRFTFSWKKEPEKERVDRSEEGLPAAERSIEAALGEREPGRDNINRALCVLIAKVDRFYQEAGSQLDLCALRALLRAVLAASEHRLFYAGLACPALTPTTSLLARVSQLLASLPNRPLVHQMLVWPAVAQHFVQAACCADPEVSRHSLTALNDSAAQLLLSEPAGVCFNHALLTPFQSIVCADTCSSETREQLVLSLADFVRQRSDRVGSGWKPLFGALRAVRTSAIANASVHWTVLDLIATYLSINKCAVLSWSLSDCITCIVHFLQSSCDGEPAEVGVAAEGGAVERRTTSEENGEIRLELDERKEETQSELDEQLSQAALKLIAPIHAVLLNLYNTPHIPNHNLVTRLAVRCEHAECVEWESSSSSLPPLSSLLDPVLFAHSAETHVETLDALIDAPAPSSPFSTRASHERASLELQFSLLEQLAGLLRTAPLSVQAALPSAIHDLLHRIRDSSVGTEIAAYCVSTLLLPHVQKWLRTSVESADRAERDRDGQPERDGENNLKQAIGTCTQIVVDLVEANPGGEWETRLLSDMLRLSVACCAASSVTARVGAAALRHLSSLAPRFAHTHWQLLANALWHATSATLFPARQLLSFVECEGGEGRVLAEGPHRVCGRIRLLAAQVFLVDSQLSSLSQEDDEDEESADDVYLLLWKGGGERHRLPLSSLIQALLAQQQLLQLIGQLLVGPAPSHPAPAALAGVLLGGGMDAAPTEEARTTMYHCLDASFQVATEWTGCDSLFGLLSRLLSLPAPSLHKQAVASGSLKLFSMFDAAIKDGGSFSHLIQCHSRLVAELERAERAAGEERQATAIREYRQQKFEFILVDGLPNGEDKVENGDSPAHPKKKLYRFVTDGQIENYLSEYQKQRPVGIAPKTKERKNPFGDKPGTCTPPSEEQPSSSLLRLISLRQLALLPPQLLLSSPSFSSLLPHFLPSVTSLLTASPDLTVRLFGVAFLHKVIDSKKE